MLTVNDVMTPQVITIKDDQTIKNAARVMANHGISSLIVFSADGLKGILTEKDIVTRVV
jgi:CBS domain-containing protein